MEWKTVQEPESCAQYSKARDSTAEKTGQKSPAKKITRPNFSGLSTSVQQFRQLDLPFVTPESEFYLIHGGHDARVTYAHSIKTANGGEEWIEKTYPHDEAAWHSGAYDGFQDVFMSQNAFTFRRSVAHIRVITMAWVDCDTRNVPGLEEFDAEQLLDLVLDRFPALPMPTMLYDSGRGVHFKWLFDKSIGRKQLEAWQTVMLALNELLADYGADLAAIDVARVMRASGTINSKNGRSCTGLQWTSPIAFEALRCAVMDLHREHREPIQKPTQSRTVIEKFSDDYSPSTPTKKPTNRHRQPFTIFTLHESRLNDITDVVALRSPVTDGRKMILHHYACSIAWYRPDVRAIADECFYLAMDYFGGKSGDRPTGHKITEAEARKLAERAARTAQNKLDNRHVVSGMWDRRRVDYRYTYRNRRIINELGITRDEMRSLRILIDSAEKQRRREEKRRAKGVRARADYLADAEARRDAVLRMQDQGMTASAIAAELGMTKRHVNRIIAAAEPDIFDGIE